MTQKRLRVVALSHHYPLRAGDWKAPFVVARVAALAKRVDVTVVHGVPWYQGLPADEAGGADGSVPVRRARYLYAPGVGKRFDGRLLARATADAVTAARPDVIEAQFGYPDGEAAVLHARRIGCVVAIVLRGTEQILAKTKVRGERLRTALRAADVVLPVSQTLGDLARSLGVDGDRVRVVENGIDTTVFRPGDRAAARARVGLPAEGRVLLGIGHFVPNKGYGHALEAFASLVAAHPDLRLVLIGHGPDEERLRAQIAELGIADRVILPGVQPHEAIADWQRACDLFVHSSLSEGRPNVVLEAQACGLPAVATDVGGTREVVLDGVTGRIVPPRNPVALAAAIDASLRAPFDRGVVARHGGARTWDDTARALEDAYRTALGRRRAPAAAAR